ncbi:MAG: DnaA regulatory inactivator Hda [Leptothrix sp. (in: Bacteria)]|nr:DnaA regulatory inactivator Hda [Leptothrix sp. (in: b-proteobacteria)]
MKQIPLPIGPLPEPTFENFLPGGNAAALDHLRALVTPAAPVYLWGSGGSGKSHLLRGLAASCQAQGQRAGWFDASARQPWVFSPDWSLVVIDRCDALDTDAQQAAFTLFIEAAAHGVQVAAAGRLPPVDLPLRDDLRTRLGWGHVFALQPLPDAETRAALRREGDRRGILLSDELMDHLLTHFPRDLGHLMQLFDRLDTFSLARSRRLSVPLLRQMLSEEATAAADIA